MVIGRLAATGDRNLARPPLKSTWLQRKKTTRADSFSHVPRFLYLQSGGLIN